MKAFDDKIMDSILEALQDNMAVPLLELETGVIFNVLQNSFTYVIFIDNRNIARFVVD